MARQMRTRRGGREGAASYFPESGAEIATPGGHRGLQYRIVLTTPDGGSTALLEEVESSVRG